MCQFGMRFRTTLNRCVLDPLGRPAMKTSQAKQPVGGWSRSNIFEHRLKSMSNPRNLTYKTINQNENLEQNKENTTMEKKHLKQFALQGLCVKMDRQSPSFKSPIFLRFQAPKEVHPASCNSGSNLRGVPFICFIRFYCGHKKKDVALF